MILFLINNFSKNKYLQRDDCVDFQFSLLWCFHIASPRKRVVSVNVFKQNLLIIKELKRKVLCSQLLDKLTTPFCCKITKGFKHFAIVFYLPKGAEISYPLYFYNQYSFHINQFFVNTVTEKKIINNKLTMFALFLLMLSFFLLSLSHLYFKIT